MFSNIINSIEPILILIENIIGIYSLFFLLTYLLFVVFAFNEIKFFQNSKYLFKYKEFLLLDNIPGVSIIAPAFNEEVTIIDNVNSLLSLEYPNYEVIIINDGSSDNTLELLINNFNLIKTDLNYKQKIDSKEIRGIYKSLDKNYKNLKVIDKINGGCKADASNAGINFAKHDYFLSTDVDCILKSDTLFKMLKPFISSSKKVLAVGAGIKAINSSSVERGILKKVVYPKSFFPSFQEIEYTRAFVFGRMAMSKINSLILVSGGLGMFDKKVVIEAGGYNHTSLAEDLDLVIRMRKIYDEKNEDYKVVYIPETLCWTEVPPNREVFIRQRIRWARGLIQTLVIYKNLFFNKKYKKTGFIALPYFLLFEFLVPIFELLGILLLLIKFIFFGVNLLLLLKIVFVVYLFYVLVNYLTIYVDEFSDLHYNDNWQIAKKMLLVLIEPIVFHPFALYASLVGYYNFLTKKKLKWGKMIRTGFNVVKNA